MASAFGGNRAEPKRCRAPGSSARLRNVTINRDVTQQGCEAARVMPCQVIERPRRTLPAGRGCGPGGPRRRARCASGRLPRSWLPRGHRLVAADVPPGTGMPSPDRCGTGCGRRGRLGAGRSGPTISRPSARRSWTARPSASSRRLADGLDLGRGIGARRGAVKQRRGHARVLGALILVEEADDDLLPHHRPDVDVRQFRGGALCCRPSYTATRRRYRCDGKPQVRILPWTAIAHG